MKCKPGDVMTLTPFAIVSLTGEPLLVPFYISLNADISGPRKITRKDQQRSLQFFLYFRIKE